MNKWSLNEIPFKKQRFDGNLSEISIQIIPSDSIDVISCDFNTNEASICFKKPQALCLLLLKWMQVIRGNEMFFSNYTFAQQLVAIDISNNSAVHIQFDENVM